MNSLPVLERHPSLRWLVPAVVVGVLVTVVVNAVRSGDEPDTSLPTVSAGKLISQVRTDERPDFSGTAIVQLSQSAAALSAFAAVSAPTTSLAGMQAGSHTLRLWYGGRTQERIALVGALAETDVFRSGNELWQWSSAQRVAVHSTAPVKSAAGIWLSAVTPVDLADQMLAAAQVDTTVSVAGAEQVAGRPAYGLVLTPRSPDTLVDYVHIAVDGATKTPLAVQIYSREDTEAAIDVAFTDVRFANQNDNMFTFHPPAGATVQKAKQPVAGTTSYGSGWTAVLCFHTARADVLPQTELGASTAVTVKGQWGRGRLVQSPLLTALTTQNGRTYVGPVRPAALYAAAASEKR